MRLERGALDYRYYTCNEYKYGKHVGRCESFWACMCICHSVFTLTGTNVGLKFAILGKICRLRIYILNQWSYIQEDI